MATNVKYVFAFEEGDGKNKKLLGGKGANLCEMTQIGLRVPPGFVISTEACLAYLDDADRRLPGGVMDEVRAQMKGLEAKTGKSFGGRDNPLLVSVRSGSAMSMPGMMDTILNLGLNAETLEGLIAQTGNERFCYDAYRRFIQLFGKVALGVPDHEFDTEFDAAKARAGVKHDVGLSAKDLKEIWSDSSTSWSASPACHSRPTPTPSSKSPSKRCSTPGRANARWITAASSTSHPRWRTAPQSTLSPWCSATWATTRPPASASRATRAPART